MKLLNLAPRIDLNGAALFARIDQLAAEHKAMQKALVDIESSELDAHLERLEKTAIELSALASRLPRTRAPLTARLIAEPVCIKSTRRTEAPAWLEGVVFVFCLVVILLAFAMMG